MKYVLNRLNEDDHKKSNPCSTVFQIVLDPRLLHVAKPVGYSEKQRTMKNQNDLITSCLLLVTAATTNNLIEVLFCCSQAS